MGKVCFFHIHFPEIPPEIHNLRFPLLGLCQTLTTSVTVPRVTHAEI